MSPHSTIYLSFVSDKVNNKNNIFITILGTDQTPSKGIRLSWDSRENNGHFFFDKFKAVFYYATFVDRIDIKADFHSAFFVARATFLLFKLNSFPLHSTWKLRRQKKKIARATKKAEWNRLCELLAGTN